MIHYLKRKELNIQKYDACIEAAYNSRIYAYSWYLDIVADNWDALVLNDYEAVMPLPFMRLKRYLFFKKIVQPHFCQQLGIFSKGEINKQDSDAFMQLFINLKPKHYNFNSKNRPVNNSKFQNFGKKDNYELGLNKKYSEIITNYSKNLRRNISKANNKQLHILNNITTKDFIDLKKQTKHHKVSKKLFKIMKELIDNLCARKVGKLYGVYQEESLIAAAFFIYEPKRIVHLFSASTSIGKQYGAIPFLFDELIKKNENSNVVFDFEGSMIEGVAKFFRSFGSGLVNYTSYQN